MTVYVADGSIPYTCNNHLVMINHLRIIIISKIRNKRFAKMNDNNVFDNITTNLKWILHFQEFFKPRLL